MRFGGPIFEKFANPEEWVLALKKQGYSAAYCPVDHTAPEALIYEYEQAAHKADIIIAEVGAWSNPMSRDEKTRKEALNYCQKQLALAEKIGAKCCVNISGSLSEQWDGPHPDNLTEDTFALVVDSVREIIDAVKPTRTFYTLELMPWMYPDSVDSYLKLIKAIERKEFAVHLDPVNIISSPQAYFNNGALINECFEKLGLFIKSCHAKDIRLESNLTVHLNEQIPGEGYVDYKTYIRCLNMLDKDTALMMEHLPSEAEYLQAAQYIRKAAGEVGVSLR